MDGSKWGVTMRGSEKSYRATADVHQEPTFTDSSISQTARGPSHWFLFAAVKSIGAV